MAKQPVDRRRREWITATANTTSVAIAVAVAVGALLLYSTSARADSGQLQFLFDTDLSTATGCTVSTPEGNFVGAELRLTATVDPDAATIGSLQLATCSAGEFGAPESIAAPFVGPWSIALDNGEAGSDLFEAYVPLDRFGDATSARVGVVLSDDCGSDALIAGPTGSMLIDVSVPEVPALGAAGAALLAGALLVLLMIVRRRPGVGFAVMLALMLMAASRAGALFGEGVLINWGSLAALGSDEGDDGTASIELHALYASRQNVILYLRVDARWLLCAPTPYCGDGTCDSGETCTTCAGDCGGCYGAACSSNGQCESGHCYNHPYSCNPHSCNPRFCCGVPYVGCPVVSQCGFVLCADTCYDTCYDTCDDYWCDL